MRLKVHFKLCFKRSHWHRLSHISSGRIFRRLLFQKLCSPFSQSLEQIKGPLPEDLKARLGLYEQILKLGWKLWFKSSLSTTLMWLCSLSQAVERLIHPTLCEQCIEFLERRLVQQLNSSVERAGEEVLHAFILVHTKLLAFYSRYRWTCHISPLACSVSFSAELPSQWKSSI